jgi:hypothetical protein
MAAPVVTLVALACSAGDTEALVSWDDLRNRLERRWAEEEATWTCLAAREYPPRF